MLSELSYLKWRAKSYLQDLLLKSGDANILPSLTGPPSQVSQVEIEAGDSEGRLPLVIFGPWDSGLLCLAIYSVRRKCEICFRR